MPISEKQKTRKTCQFLKNKKKTPKLKTPILNSSKKKRQEKKRQFFENEKKTPKLKTPIFENAQKNVKKKRLRQGGDFFIF